MTDWYPNPPYPASGPPPYGPPGGYVAPPQLPGYSTDPLISPDYNGWWSRGLFIVKRGWRPLAALQAVGVVLSLLVQAPVLAYAAVVSDDLGTGLETPDPATPSDLAPMFGVFGLTLMGVFVSLILAAMVTVATVHIGVSVAVGTEVRIADALLLAARRAFPLLGWQLLAAPIYLVALCLCVLPVLYVGAVFVVLPVVVAVERTNVISRCFSLFHGNLGSSVARIATIMGLGLAGSLAGVLTGGLGDGLVQLAVPDTSGVVGGSVVSTLLGVLTSGALAVLLTPLALTAYADMRARVEPVNTMVIAQELNIVPPAPGQAGTAPPAADPWQSWPSWPAGPTDPPPPPPPLRPPTPPPG
ncbi:MAG TPA: hypothetical protein VFB84_12055 [Micromonosporaceae bacterium]|nr:hypothetical protein [Micromonosporaceae bacterium]